MNRILVTGGAGFIGSHVVDVLVGMKQEVTVLDDLSAGARENVHPKAGFVLGSITDPQLVRSLFQVARFSHVFHLAAYEAEGLSSFVKRFNYQNNLLGSVNLLNAAITYGVSRVVFTSSVAVYGCRPGPLTEDMAPEPMDSYAIAKYAVEQELAVCFHMFGLEYVVFRPYNLFGERQNLDSRCDNLVGAFTSQLSRGDTLTVYGDGGQTWGVTYIGDVAPAIARSAFVPQARNQVFNIGGDQRIRIHDLAREIARALGVTPTIRHLPAREEPPEPRCSHQKIESLLGWRAKTSIPEGLMRMAPWVKTQFARPNPGLTGMDTRKNLPPHEVEKA